MSGLGNSPLGGFPFGDGEEDPPVVLARGCVAATDSAPYAVALSDSLTQSCVVSDAPSPDVATVSDSAPYRVTVDDVPCDEVWP